MNKQKRWEVLSKASLPGSKSDIEDVLRVLLKNRGIRTPKERREFFSPKDPEKITLKELKIKESEVKKAVLRIKKALKSGEKVFVYGDYDADGICGTAILWEVLYALGLNVLPYIPERFGEGYGLNSESIEKLKKDNPDLGLIITVDHGIVAEKKVARASDLGIDVIITDHHTPDKKHPKCFACVHTTLIGGAAVAWVLSREIRKRLKPKESKLTMGSGLDLAAIGTIADQIPLLGANRSLVKFGLKELNKTERPGLKALFDVAGIKKGEIGPYEVGFLIAPRINAMGRLEHALESLRLLCVRNLSKAQQLAYRINTVNTERQRIVDEVVIHARKSSALFSEGIITLSHKSYHEGVIGLAAAKLTEEFYRPAIVFSEKKGVSKASARSIAGINIIELIRKLEGLYLEGGGHPMAAGFSIETSKIGEFIKKINREAKPLLSQEMLTKKLKIDMELEFNLINRELLKKLKEFEPTGTGNPAPLFVARDVQVVASRAVGRDLSHLKLKVKQGEKPLDAIAFGFGEMSAKLAGGGGVDAVYTVEENVFNGVSNLQLKVRDIRIL